MYTIIFRLFWRSGYISSNMQCRNKNKLLIDKTTILAYCIFLQVDCEHM